ALFSLEIGSRCEGRIAHVNLRRKLEKTDDLALAAGCGNSDHGGLRNRLFKSCAVHPISFYVEPDRLACDSDLPVEPRSNKRYADFFWDNQRLGSFDFRRLQEGGFRVQ